MAAVPTFLFFQNGKVIQRIEGAKAADVTKAVQTLAKTKARPKTTTEATPKEPVQETPEELNKRLKSLIESSAVMLFMKGDPVTPKCGFSRQTIELLNEVEAKFGSFDILTDDAVRQGLKTYSDWPTFPQLYVKGLCVNHDLNNFAKNFVKVKKLVKS